MYTKMQSSKREKSSKYFNIGCMNWYQSANPDAKKCSKKVWSRKKYWEVQNKIKTRCKEMRPKMKEIENWLVQTRLWGSR